MDSTSPNGLGKMVRLSRRHALIGGLLMAAGVAAEVRRPEVTNPAVAKKTFKAWVPDKAGSWTSQGIGDLVLPPEDELSDRLYDNLITRVYRGADDREVMLLLAYNNRQDGMLQVHRPEVCYPVGGYTLTDTKAAQLDLGSQRVSASEFTASGPGRTEHVLYFTRIGQAFPRSWSQQRTAVVQENLRGSIPDGIMMRLSSLSPKKEDAMEDMRAFSQDFYRAAAPQLRTLLTGKS